MRRARLARMFWKKWKISEIEMSSDRATAISDQAEKTTYAPGSPSAAVVICSKKAPIYPPPFASAASSQPPPVSRCIQARILR